jgi:hypothetical protein
MKLDVLQRWWFRACGTRRSEASCRFDTAGVGVGC